VTVTTPTEGTVCNPNAKTSYGDWRKCTKFDVSSFSLYGDILGWG